MMSHACHVQHPIALALCLNKCLEDWATIMKNIEVDNLVYTSNILPNVCYISFREIMDFHMLGFILFDYIVAYYNNVVPSYIYQLHYKIQLPLEWS